MVRMYDMKQKEVINVKDGCRYGFICDVEIDEHCGKVISIIVPGPGRILGMFGNDQEYKIPWCDICHFGGDIVLVDVDTKGVLIDCGE